MFIKNQLNSTPPPPEKFKLSTVIISLLFFLLFSSFSLVACNTQNSESKADPVALTTDNYKDYLVVNVYYTDCIVLESSESTEYSTRYNLYCIAHIETAPKGDYRFSNVELQYNYNAPLWDATTNKAKTDIDYYGYSHCSFSVKYFMEDSTTSIKFPCSSPSHIKIQSISGTVFIAKETAQ